MCGGCNHQWNVFVGHEDRLAGTGVASRVDIIVGSRDRSGVVGIDRNGHRARVDGALVVGHFVVERNDALESGRRLEGESADGADIAEVTFSRRIELCWVDRSGQSGAVDVGGVRQQVGDVERAVLFDAVGGIAGDRGIVHWQDVDSDRGPVRRPVGVFKRILELEVFAGTVRVVGFRNELEVTVDAERRDSPIRAECGDCRHTCRIDRSARIARDVVVVQEARDGGYLERQFEVETGIGTRGTAIVQFE